MGKTVAFFDFDGTLCTAQVWRGLGEWARTAPRRRLAYVWSLRLLPMGYWPLYRLRLLGEGTFFNLWGNGVASLFRGMPYAQARAVCQQVARQHLIPALRSDVMERLRAHQAQGEEVVLVSGTLAEAVEAVAHHLGIPTVLATPLQVHNDICTGRMDGPFLYGALKAQRLLQFAREHTPPLDLSLCWAYADRRWDIPFLEAVGRPVAVYPDRVLKAYAEKRGWEVLGARP
ncbi:MAG: HAD-IB family hydrolase [Dehalococcoidia bacterium]|nr:HAD-IB family hydrolase [Dehalococcoidia bacterium]MDW8120564.1 HAD-IB family hydrolase [Chloroflexota bacterium]